MTLTVTPPVNLPVTLDEVKAHSSVDFPDDDALLDLYIRGAVSHLDGPSGILGRALMAQSAVLQVSGLSQCVRLPYGTATSLTSVNYYDADNVQQTLAGFSLHSDDDGSYLWFDLQGGDLPPTYSRPDAVEIAYEAGWSDASSIPQAIKVAIYMMCTTWFCQREDFVGSNDITRVPLGIKELVAPWRKVPV